MSIVSITYFLFVIAVAAIYYLVPMKVRWVVLLLASGCFFVLNSSVPLFCMTLGMIAVAYVAALVCANMQVKVLGATDKSERIKLEHFAKATVTIAVALEAVTLIILQDNAFFITTVNVIAFFFQSDFSLPLPTWAVPLGVSYFTLMLIGYILDVHWGTSEAEKNPAKLALFTIFFPQMISGPISRFNQVKNTLFLGNRFDHKNIEFGAQRILWGLFKKLVIAERLAIIVRCIVSDYTAFPGGYFFVAAFAYTLQVYADFSASMDIVLGAAQIFGITLPENFQNPFFEQNLSAWWRKWHVTLGLWIKDYILYPLLKAPFMRKTGKFCKKKFGKKAGKDIPVYIGLLVTWFSVGFWHGGLWCYILGSGLCFFVMIAGGMLLKPFTDKLITTLKINTSCFAWKFFCAIRTFVLFSCAIFVGRAGSVSYYLQMAQHAVLQFNGLELFNTAYIRALQLSGKDYLVLGLSLGVAFLIEVLQTRLKIRETITQKNFVFRWVLWIILFFSFIILGIYGPGYNAADFIYGGF